MVGTFHAGISKIYSSPGYSSSQQLRRRALSTSLSDLRAAASTSSSFYVSLVQALRWGDGHFRRGVLPPEAMPRAISNRGTLSLPTRLGVAYGMGSRLIHTTRFNPVELLCDGAELKVLLFSFNRAFIEMAVSYSP